jgi:hypothetical protein
MDNCIIRLQIAARPKHRRPNLTPYNSIILKHRFAELFGQFFLNSTITGNEPLGLCIGIDHGYHHRPTRASPAPLRRARLAPRPLFLPRQSGSPEHLPDRCGADLG